VKNKWLAWLLVAALCCSVAAGIVPVPGTGTAEAASDVIYWGDEERVVYDRIHPYTLNWTGNVLDRGGLNLIELAYTSDSSDADIVMNQYGDIGASAILELQEELSDPTKRNVQGFSNSLDMEQGAVYLVVLHDGSHAKLRIDRMLPDNGFSITKVQFTYVLEVPEDSIPNPEGQGSGGAAPPASLDIGSPARDILDPAASYVFEEDGAITIPWERLPGEAAWDLYRSDNGAPYVKVTDFMLTEPEYTDYYTFAGRTYMYKLASYDAAGRLLSVSSAIKVTIVAAGTSLADDTEKTKKRIQLQIGNKTAYVDDKAHTLEAAPFTYNGRTVLPLRFVGEALGAEVKWDGKTRSITLTSGSDTIVLVIDSSAARVNGKTVMMDVPAFVHNQITMVPIRFASEQFKQKITFDNKTQIILIESEAWGPASGQSGGSGQSGSAGNAQPSASEADYFIGDWSMRVPAGKDSADGGILSIYEDGTISYRWNGTKTGTWKLDKATGKLLLTGYKSGWDWTVTRTESGITVSTYGVHEIGTRL